MSEDDRVLRSQVNNYRVDGYFGITYRGYVVGDPTENSDHASKHRAVLVLREVDGGILAKVVTPDTFFPVLFTQLQQYEHNADRKELWDLCELHIKLFGSVSPLNSYPGLIFTAEDIPVTTEKPLPEKVSRMIRPPVTRFHVEEGDGLPDVEISMNASFMTWDDLGGMVKAWQFHLKYYPFSQRKSETKITEKLIAEDVGEFD